MKWRVVVSVGVAVAAAGCSSTTGPTGIVTGTYIRVGGPSGAPNVPLPGTITFRASDGSTTSVNSDRTGKFTGQLPPGTYAVTAKSNLINEGKYPCSRPLTARVRAGTTVSLTLICDIR